MLIAKVEDNQILQIADYREMFRNVSFSGSINEEFMQENGLLGVTVWKPHSRSEKLVSCTPYIEDNQVFTVQVEDKSASELEADAQSEGAKVRSHRNYLLSSSDWTQLADAPIDTNDWAVYRQALRDITDQLGFPWEVQWPTQPTPV